MTTKKKATAKKKAPARVRPQTVRPVMPKWSMIPRSRAENSYQLLDEVIAVIDAEPKRLDMGAWARVKGVMPDEAPACGTIGCIAGWMDILTHRQGVIKHVNEGSGGGSGYYSGRGVWHEALELLPPSLRYAANSLFTDRLDHLPPSGTRKHADAVIQRIREFQRSYGPQLLGHVVTPTR